MARQTDKLAMDRLQRLLSGTDWSPASELLDAIEAIVRSTGRPVLDNDGRWTNSPTGPSWRDRL